MGALLLLLESALQLLDLVLQLLTLPAQLVDVDALQLEAPFQVLHCGQLAQDRSQDAERAGRW